MEIGATLLDNISIAGDSAHIPDDLFLGLVRSACKGVLFEEHRHVVAGRLVNFYNTCSSR